MELVLDNNKPDLINVKSMSKSSSWCYHPVMGTAALLARAKSFHVEKIVENLVMEKYHPALSHCDDKSLTRRQTRKRKSTISNDLLSSSSESTYDEIKFLKEALGDELDAYSSSSEIRQDRSISTCEISDLMSYREETFDSTRSTDALLKSINSCRTSTPVPETTRDDLERERLLHQILIQEHIIRQTSKVIAFCRNSKEFASSDEYVEAEKILLLAMYKKEFLMKQQSGFVNILNRTNPSLTSGYVRITSVQFPTKMINSNVPRGRKKSYSYKFVCVIVCGQKLLCSKVEEASKNGGVKFKDEFLLDDLRDDFEMRIFLYSLLITKNTSNQKEHIATCPSPRKLFNSSPRSRERKAANVSMTLSSFSQWGYFVVRLGDVHKKGDFPMTNVPLRSTLQGVAKIELQSGVNGETLQEAFLNLGVKNTSQDVISWNRIWCRLEGEYLNFWLYPSERCSNPVTVISLKDCQNYPVTSATREICTRSRTLHLLIKKIHYFLSFDSTAELNVWKDQINSIIMWCINVNMN